LNLLEIKTDYIIKAKEESNSLKCEYLTQIISNHNLFRNFCILRGYSLAIPKDINEDLISVDNQRSYLILKAFIENSHSSGINSINNNYSNYNNIPIPAYNANNNAIFKNCNNLSTQNFKKDECQIQKIALRFDYIISLFNNKLEEVPLIAAAEQENDFVNHELEIILNAIFAIILNSDAKKNLIITYTTEMFNKSKEKSGDNDDSPGFILPIILKLMELFIKLVNQNTTKLLLNENKNTSQTINSVFDFSLSMVAKESISKVFEFKGINSSNNLIFDLESFSKNMEDLFSDTKEISESILGIHLKTINLSNESQISLLICNAHNQDFILSILKRAKNQNLKKIKKDAAANPSNSNVATLNTEPKSLTTINNQRTLNTTTSGLDNIFEEIETKFINTYFSFIDITANFVGLKEEKTLPLYCEERIYDAKKKLNQEFYSNINSNSNLDSNVKYRTLSSLAYFDNSPITNINNIKEEKENNNFQNDVEASNFNFKAKNITVNNNFDKISRDSKRQKLYSKDNVKYNLEEKTIKELTKFFS